MQHFETLSMSNLFSFTCPIFAADVQMRSCVKLRNLVYQGKRIETRRGCQACIKSGMCPAAELVRRIAFATSDATDHCSSPEQKLGRLPADVLERIRPVMINDSHVRNHNVSTDEQNLIATAGARIDAQIATAPRGAVAGKAQRFAIASATPTTTTASKPKTTAASTVNTINKAAASGDLAAAINA